MKKLMGEQLNHREIDEILRDVDLNGDGQVDFEGDTIYLLLKIGCGDVFVCVCGGGVNTIGDDIIFLKIFKMTVDDCGSALFPTNNANIFSLSTEFVRMMSR